MSNAIQVTKRNTRTKSELKQMRASGHIPAVVYGNEVGSIPIDVSESEITAVLRRNPRAILQVELEGHGKQPVLVHQIQRHVLTGKLLHIDFQQINMKENIDTMVRIQLLGEPAGVKEGGILQVEAYEVHIRCMPDRLPGSLEIDISGLNIGENLLFSDLKLAEGLELLSDPSGMIVTVLNVQKAEAEEETVAEATDAGAAEAEEVATEE